jgi:hypothetical protein
LRKYTGLQDALMTGGESSKKRRVDEGTVEKESASGKDLMEREAGDG